MISTMWKPLLACAALWSVAACAPQIPDSGAAYDTGYAAREAELSSGAASADRLTPQQPLDATGLNSAAAVPATANTAAPDSAEGIAAETAAVLAGGTAATAQTTTTGAGTIGQLNTSAQSATVPTSSTVEAAPVVTATGISVENDFSAVSEARSIQGDAALIEQNRAQYEVIQPTAVPTRTGGSGPNIVEYALSTSHPKGTRIYSRTGINLEGRSARNCAKFASADLAQIEFLSTGGPTRDRAALDPDGDGYACTWDPAPFRKAQNG